MADDICSRSLGRRVRDELLLSCSGGVILATNVGCKGFGYPIFIFVIVLKAFLQVFPVRTLGVAVVLTEDVARCCGALAFFGGGDPLCPSRCGVVGAQGRVGYSFLLAIG